MNRVLAIALTSKTLSPAFISTSQVIDQSIIVIATQHFSLFAMMAGSLHYWWSISYGTPMRTDARYSITNCFETFPFPARLTGLDSIGQRYHDYRCENMLTRQEGLTKTYNRFHDPDEISTDIQKLRQLHVEMDQAVAAAYGWTDLDLGHGFHPTRQGLRYTISEAARREILGRLLKLNHERYAEEVAKGLHEKKSKKAGGSKVKVNPEEGGGLYS
jgi:hypothetical protein